MITGSFEIDKEAALKDLNEDGFFITKGFFNPKHPHYQEILDAEGQEALGGRTVPAVFHRSSLSNSIVIPDNLRKVSFTLFETPFFTGHSDLHQNIRTGWHRDDGTTIKDHRGYFGESRVGIDEILVVKFATYIEDDRYSGLWIRPGTHKTKDKIKKPIFVRCAYPDAIVFDVRLLHRGNSRFSPAHIFKKKRTSIFFTITEDTPLARKFSEKNWQRQIIQASTKVNPTMPLMEEMFK